MGLSQADLDVILQQYVPAAHDTLGYQRFGPGDFERPESEEFLWFFRESPGARRQYATLSHFWVAALHSCLEDSVDAASFAQLARAALCRPVNGAWVLARYNEVTARLGPQVTRPKMGRILEAYEMYADWNLVAVAADTTEGYQAFLWETTA